MADSGDVRRREEGGETKEEVVYRKVRCSADENALVLGRDELSDNLKESGQARFCFSARSERGRRSWKTRRTSTRVCVLPVPGGPWMHPTSCILSANRTASFWDALRDSSNHLTFATVSKSVEKEAGEMPYSVSSSWREGWFEGSGEPEAWLSSVSVGGPGCGRPSSPLGGSSDVGVG